VHLTTIKEAANQTKPNTAKASYMYYNRIKSRCTMMKLSEKRNTLNDSKYAYNSKKTYRHICKKCFS